MPSFLPCLLPSISLFCRYFYEVLRRWSFWVRGGRITRGVECAVHQTAQPSLSPNDDITGARLAHTKAHTQISCRLASGCLSTRLHRWLTGALMECVTAESGVCMSLGVCGVSWMYRRTEAWSTRWPGLPYELIVTQLIAEPATDLAVASSPCNPTAVLLVHDRVCVTQLASGEQRMLSRWVYVYVCAHAHSFCSLSEASHSKISVSVL